MFEREGERHSQINQIGICENHNLLELASGERLQSSRTYEEKIRTLL